MLKRVILFTFVLSTLALLALAPFNVSPASDHSAKLQETLVVTVAVVTATPGAGGIPVTGMPASTMIIVALLVILGIAVVIGGFALMSRRA